MSHPDHRPHIRVSDAERSHAIDALGSHFAQGRLDLNEYDRRITQATEARDAAELNTLFADLPALSPGSALMPMYSAAEIQRVNKTSKNTKAGLFSLVTIGSITASMLTDQAMWLVLIPTVFVLLYVMKLGPDSWHAPSQRQLDRQRLRAIKLEHSIQQHHRKAIRQEMKDELTESALRFARNKFTNR